MWFHLSCGFHDGDLGSLVATGTVFLLRGLFLLKGLFSGGINLKLFLNSLGRILCDWIYQKTMARPSDGYSPRLLSEGIPRTRPNSVSKKLEGG